MQAGGHHTMANDRKKLWEYNDPFLTIYSSEDETILFHEEIIEPELRGAIENAIRLAERIVKQNWEAEVKKIKAEAPQLVALTEW